MVCASRFEGKCFYDFMLNCQHAKGKGPFADVVFEILAGNLMFIEVPEVPTTKNIRARLNEAFLLKYEMSPNQFIQGNTLVTDAAAIVEGVVNASVWKETHNLDEIWMGCTAHSLNNVMKSMILFNCHGLILEIVFRDFSAMKKVSKMLIGGEGTTCFPWVPS